MPRNVEDDFIAAFHRISAGAPTHPKLCARLAAGKNVAANQSTVALEAGHSRTLISQRAPGYERICELLSSAGEAAQPISQNSRQSRSETSTERLARLTAEVRLLTMQRDRFATSLSEAYLALSIKDRDIASLSEQVNRRDSNRIDSDSFDP